ncbi:alternative ribosome rescue aminoacyl-tRNA hydrolase ArfB [Sphingobacterium cellulitidis]|uniref:Aminoacyl-tRNA hydrolase n=1 Tax=Sphingobacterium cellulitidis TaxID=1768011 RepID=A0A8H9FWZ7_9SPHI|nr:MULTISPECIES: alternative ribosome rescue aminoacyl-tRNA hydrolase ArfB [Sphingobacterium]MBA8985717.1 ribosome-associated protein [Sphingobacterium soli]WFB64129.1 alternative ribosome rescue aminoacyl-tRNA hydrolase ArfB [Sphingobacterium sp. WM]GGE07477.1 aminoacyl-tRNA hydrolase [Sphingobacterium soli]
MGKIVILLQMHVNKEQLIQELSFKTSRSGGKGGQNVNKVSSKVMLNWNVDESSVFNEDQKMLIKERLANRISKEGLLQLDSSIDRSQLKNKELVIERFFSILENALKLDAERKPTKIPKSVILNRLDRKKKQSSKKSDRQWRFEE